MVDHYGMLEHDKIQPPTSPLPSRGNTELTPDSLEVFSDIPIVDFKNAADEHTFLYSVGKGPLPTRVKYALVTPMIVQI